VVEIEEEERGEFLSGVWVRFEGDTGEVSGVWEGNEDGASPLSPCELGASYPSALDHAMMMVNAIELMKLGLFILFATTVLRGGLANAASRRVPRSIDSVEYFVADSDVVARATIVKIDRPAAAVLMPAYVDLQVSEAIKGEGIKDQRIRLHVRFE